MAGELTPRVESIAALLRLFDDQAAAVADIWCYKWGKLAYGSLLFLTALANETMADTLSDPEHRPLLVALAREVIAVGRATGTEPVGFDGFDARAFEAGTDPALATSSLLRMANHYRSSTKQHSGVWRDLAVRKRKTEVDTQIAEIVRTAQTHGLGATVTATLIEFIHEVENGGRRIDRSNLFELAERVLPRVATR
jgi:2-dehydropantoate 2-reductase